MAQPNELYQSDTIKYKQCYACKESKPTADFSIQRCRPDGLEYRCRACMSKVRAERAKTEHHKNYHRDYSRKRWYGMKPGQYDEMFARQNGKCLACGEPPKKNQLHVDHDHRTMEIRGLLCIHCNLSLGKVHDNVPRLRQLITYLG